MLTFTQNPFLCLGVVLQVGSSEPNLDALVDVLNRVPKYDLRVLRILCAIRQFEHRDHAI